MPPEKKRVLVTTSTYWRWKGDSLYSFVHELSRRIGKSYAVYVLAPHSRGSANQEKVDGITVLRFRYFPPRYERLCEQAIVPNLKKNPLLWFQVPFFFMAQLFAVRKAVRKLRIDIIHAHWLIPQGLIAVVYKLLFNRNIKVMVTVHGTDIHGLQWRPLRILKRWIIDTTHHLTVVSNALRDDVLKLRIKTTIPVDVVPMGVDFSQFHPENHDETIKTRFGITGPFILSVGRLSAAKGIEYLIHAVASLPAEFSKLKLIVIGDGEAKSALEALAKQLEVLDNSIFFIGPVPHDSLPHYYATADIFVGPSTSEGLGLVFVEAIASGTFTIGTDLPALRDIIDDGRTGFVVEEKNPADIADKITYTLQNKEALKEIPLRAREELVQKFDWSVITRKYRDIIDGIS